MQKDNGYLHEVLLLRPLAIILLVLYHAFIPYIHGWKQQFDVFEDNVVYWWIAKTSYACMLELFVFISGYVFALYIKKQPSIYDIVRNKLQRLIIPSILFGTIYIALFFDQSDIRFPGVLYQLLCGIAHLWFLPMLFWAMLIVSLIQRLKLTETQKIILMTLFPACSVLPLPFQLGISLYYIPFFYAGTIAYVHRENAIKQAESKKRLSFLAFAAVICFIIGTLLIVKITEQLPSDIINKFFFLTAQTYIRALYSSLGVYFLYLLSCRVIYINRKEAKPFVITLNNCCFGIYIFQQFVLTTLYFHTNIPAIVGNAWIPWVGFIASITISFLLAHLVRLTTIGKKII